MSSKIIFAIWLMFCFVRVSNAQTLVDQEATLNATFAPMPLAFTENQGQWPDSILYRASAGGATMWFTPSGAYYQFTRRISRIDDSGGLSPQQKFMRDRPMEQPDSIEITMIKAEFVGANLNPSAMGLSVLDYKCNYFLGNEPDKWRTDVSNYESIQYQEVYPGVDLKYYGNGKQMEYDFVVSPGADYNQIQIRYDGAESLALAENGELIIKIDNGEIIEKPPIVYQNINGSKVDIDCNYVIGENNTFSFAVDSRYSPEHELVIDPVLIYSTYLGGNDADYSGRHFDIDGTGAAYVTGQTFSADFPTLNPYQTNLGADDDAFITKINSSGSGLVYSTYLGGTFEDGGTAVEADANGAAYVTGYTQSLNFPTVNPYLANHQGGIFDIFVSKLSNTGNVLAYSTYLGGSNWDLGYDIAVDASGAIYATGSTESNNFPTLFAYQDTYGGGTDGFVTKFTSSGSSLVYSTYLGGSNIDVCFCMDVRVNGLAGVADVAHVAGWSNSSDFPTSDSYQPFQGGGDIIVVKLGGFSSFYSTFLGGTGGEIAYDIAVDSLGAAYVTGYTNSINFPTISPYQGTYQGGTSDGFVAKLHDSNFVLFLDYSTYLGGNDEDRVWGISVDAARATHVTGQSKSTNFPTLNAYQTNQPLDDAFVTKLNTTGNSLVYSTYLGGSALDVGFGIKVNTVGVAYVSGVTASNNFPTLNPYQADQGGQDLFVTKFECCIGIRGDLNGDGADANILDLTYAVDRMFRGGPPASCSKEGDVNSDGVSIDILDLTFLVDRVYRGGPPPGPC